MLYKIKLKTQMRQLTFHCVNSYFFIAAKNDHIKFETYVQVYTIISKEKEEENRKTHS